jgi:hypothetical protein
MRLSLFPTGAFNRMNEALANEDVPIRSQSTSRIGAWLGPRRMFGLVIILSAVVYAQYQPFTQTTRGDRANWDYFAQVVSRGGVPYRDVVNIKSPLSAYIGAAAIVATRPLGLRDIYAIRMTCFAMLLMTAGLTFLAGYEFFSSMRVGLLAVLIFLGFDVFERNVAGIQPKISMILFGLLTLWAIRKDSPFLAGLCGMLSALAWQPGLLFLGAAGLAFSRYLTSWRDRNVPRVVSGALIPLAALVLYLWVAGGLRDFYLWTIHFNFTVYAPGEAKSVKEFLGYFLRMLGRPYREDILYFVLAVIGMTVILIRGAKQARVNGAGNLLEEASHHSLIIAPLAYLAFCAINVQGEGDLFPFLPFISIFSAVAVVAFLDKAGELMMSRRRGVREAFYARAAFVATCSLVFLFSVADTFFNRDARYTLQQQEADVREITSNLKPGEKLFVLGSTEILVISGLTSASKYFFLDRGKDEYLDQVEPGGFEGWFDRLKAERPKVVALGRMNSMRRKKYFEEWMSRDYEMRQGEVFSYYVRKD